MNVDEKMANRQFINEMGTNSYTKVYDISQMNINKRSYNIVNLRIDF